MTGIWHILVSGGVLFVPLLILRERETFRNTTLATAWNWSLGTSIVWGTAWFADLLRVGVSTELSDHTWYLSAVLSLSPPIAVLGSRKPGTRVWAYFILLPMLLVLGWPVLALRLNGTVLRGIQLETPQVLAYGLVLLMGIGNYCGTRFTIPALLYGAATLAIVVSTSVIAPEWLTNRTQVRFWSTVTMINAIYFMKSSKSIAVDTNLDRLWFDFFDSFGIVWGRRIQDRVNSIARQESWPCRLELDGFQWHSSKTDAGRHPEHGTSNGVDQAPIPPRENRETHQRVEYVMRWLLRRFVDPSWIDARLGSKDVSPVYRSNPSVDS